MDYYELKQDVYESHANAVDTMLMPLHVVDGSETFLTLRQRSVKLLEFCQDIEQPLTGRVILMPELWVKSEERELHTRQWGRWWLKPPFRVLLFVKTGPGAWQEPLSRLDDAAHLYVVDMDQGISPEDVYRWLLNIWLALPLNHHHE